MNKTITISKAEYERLNHIAKKYEVVRKVISHDLFEQPSTKDIKRIIKDFKAAELYNEDFLKSLERGLRESSYFDKKTK